jgi:two-component system alkaline phosphatase synthesis response regulator PhoP
MKTPSKILIADHQPEITAAAYSILQQAGYSVFEAHNEKDCLNLIFSQHPDILIIDSNLPHADVAEFCKQIKLNHDLPQLHILLMSDMEEGDTINDFEKLEYFDDYIRKPIHDKELLSKIDMYESVKNIE